MPFKLGPEYRKASSAFREVSIYSIHVPYDYDDYDVVRLRGF